MRATIVALALAALSSLAACVADEDVLEPATTDEAAALGDDAVRVSEVPAEPSPWQNAPNPGCTATQLATATTHMEQNHPYATMTGCSYNPNTGYVVYTYSCPAPNGGGAAANAMWAACVGL